MKLNTNLKLSFPTHIALLTLGIFFSCAQTTSQPVTVFLAASTQDVLEEITSLYQQNTDQTITLVAASSGTLARQIISGADFDLYLSANTRWMQEVVNEGLSEQYGDFISNSLVLVASQSPSTQTASENLLPNDFDWPAFLGDSRLSLGDPEHVPAGNYAKQALEYMNAWQDLGPKLHLAMDVRSALAVVELGEIDYGIVYKTDALSSTNVTILGTFPEESHDPIVYQLALSQLPKDEALDFYNFLFQNDSIEILKKYGFQSMGAIHE